MTSDLTPTQRLALVEARATKLERRLMLAHNQLRWLAGVCVLALFSNALVVGVLWYATR